MKYAAVMFRSASKSADHSQYSSCSSRSSAAVHRSGAGSRANLRGKATHLSTWVLASASSAVPRGLKNCGLGVSFGIRWVADPVPLEHRRQVVRPTLAAIGGEIIDEARWRERVKHGVTSYSRTRRRAFSVISRGACSGMAIATGKARSNSRRGRSRTTRRRDLARRKISSLPASVSSRAVTSPR